MNDPSDVLAGTYTRNYSVAVAPLLECRRAYSFQRKINSLLMWKADYVIDKEIGGIMFLGTSRGIITAGVLDANGNRTSIDTTEQA
ncbi:hypothetical protein O9992_29955 [Vibrio lentus]|nr:hypothetical protein [Vibrio lentus]